MTCNVGGVDTRAEHDRAVIALDNGDTFHGTYPAAASKGEAFAPLLNALHLDAVVLGLGQPATPDVHLQRVQDQLGHRQFAAARLARAVPPSGMKIVSWMKAASPT